MSNLDRVQGQNCHITITANGGTIDAGTNSLLPKVTGFVDKFTAKYNPKFNTYTPIGEGDEHDQNVGGHWMLSFQGGDRNAMLMALSRDQDHRRRNKQPLPDLTISVVGYDPDDNSEAFDFTWTGGTLQTADLTIDGADKDVVSSGDIKAKRIS